MFRKIINKINLLFSKKSVKTNQSNLANKTLEATLISENQHLRETIQRLIKVADLADLGLTEESSLAEVEKTLHRLESIEISSTRKNSEQEKLETLQISPLK